jgi:hypothetical protein
MIKLGDKVKDSVSGLVGIAVARTEYMNGCVRWAVQPQKLHNGKPVEQEYLDEQQLIVVKSARSRATRETGGDRPAPRNAANPTKW